MDSACYFSRHESIFKTETGLKKQTVFFNQPLNIHTPPKNLMFVTRLIARPPNAYWLVTNLRHLQYAHND
jgi:hypothetical protein